MTEITDEDVIERASREPEVFGLLFDRHFDVIARFCTRRIGPLQGEDLAGDVFRWAFEHSESFDPGHVTVRTWLFQIANTHVRNMQRSVVRRDLAYLRWSAREEPRQTDLAGEIAAAVDGQHDLCAVAAALELQAAEDVETLLLYAWDELSYSEIAEVLSIPTGTVRSRINRVRRHLHDVLDGASAPASCTARLQGGTQ